MTELERFLSTRGRTIFVRLVREHYDAVRLAAWRVCDDPATAEQRENRSSRGFLAPWRPSLVNRTVRRRSGDGADGAPPERR